ncbi:MAG: MBL fold metallo-hydrolase [Actinomycetota bacterium]|nr:MBL fold metallo-hydrolase [Actinomycetota bacterium]
MRLVTLGTSAAYPTIERASSGYLVNEGKTNILMDLGSGVFRNLLRWVDPSDLSAIIISHLHQDHFIDIYPMYYYLAFHRSEHLPINVYAPEGARDFILQIFSGVSGSRLDAVYSFKSLKDRMFFNIGSIKCQSIKVKHTPMAFGIRLTSQYIISYSSDTAFNEALYDIAADSDIFICEATKQDDYKDILHLTATQAGIIARKANVKNLMLTHIWPDFDPARSQQMAAEQYDGPIIIAEDNMEIYLDS